MAVSTSYSVRSPSAPAQIRARVSIESSASTPRLASRSKWAATSAIARAAGGRQRRVAAEREARLGAAAQRGAGDRQPRDQVGLALGRQRRAPPGRWRCRRRRRDRRSPRSDRTSRRRAGTKPGIEIRRPQVGVERRRRVAEPRAQDLRLAIQRGRAPRRLDVQPRQPARTPCAAASGMSSLSYASSSSSSAGARPGILRQHQLQVVARRLPLPHLGVHRAQPLPDVEQVAARVRSAAGATPPPAAGRRSADRRARAPARPAPCARPACCGFRIASSRYSVSASAASPIRSASAARRCTSSSRGTTSAASGAASSSAYRSRARVQSCVR